MTRIEEEILDGCRKGDRHAQNLLFEKFKGKIFSICRRYTSSLDEARDIQQDSFIKIFNSIVQTNREIDSIEKWIYRITVNTAIDFIRKQNLTLRVELYDQSQDVGINAEVLEMMDHDDLINVIQFVPDPYRAVFNLYIVDGYSHKEIAELLTITESTSRSYLTRAKEYLKKAIVKSSVEQKRKKYG